MICVHDFSIFSSYFARFSILKFTSNGRSIQALVPRCRVHTIMESSSMANVIGYRSHVATTALKVCDRIRTHPSFPYRSLESVITPTFAVQDWYSPCGATEARWRRECLRGQRVVDLNALRSCGPCSKHLYCRRGLMITFTRVLV